MHTLGQSVAPLAIAVDDAATQTIQCRGVTRGRQNVFPLCASMCGFSESAPSFSSCFLPPQWRCRKKTKGAQVGRIGRFSLQREQQLHDERHTISLGKNRRDNPATGPLKAVHRPLHPCSVRFTGTAVGRCVSVLRSREIPGSNTCRKHPQSRHPSVLSAAVVLLLFPLVRPRATTHIAS